MWKVHTSSPPRYPVYCRQVYRIRRHLEACSLCMFLSLDLIRLIRSSWPRLRCSGTTTTSTVISRAFGSDVCNASLNSIESAVQISHSHLEQAPVRRGMETADVFESRKSILAPMRMMALSIIIPTASRRAAQRLGMWSSTDTPSAAMLLLAGRYWRMVLIACSTGT
jgi:hypothetical protein